MKKRAFILSCEHAVNTVPSKYQSLFLPFQDLLHTHRGIDFGALDIAKHLQKALPAPLIQATVTRLLIDCNRSNSHFYCFSEVTRHLSLQEKQKLVDIYYLPFRQQVIQLIKEAIAQGLQVVHLSIHSFTPVMNGTVRNTDIGLLYDPKRTPEKLFAKQWKKAINKADPEYKVRMNYPYKGVSDGFTTALRKQFSEQDYLGLELECNQKLTTTPIFLERLKNTLLISLTKS